MANTADIIIGNTGADIFTGRATILTGGSVVRGVNPAVYYDDPTREIVVPDASGIGQFVVLQTRYIYHGGPDGSGAWEH